ncbi:MAG: SLBB domain-containing protein [Candidatus Aureabacteria bacterium]|nr:SLBB domain-containing protein [Candidatus Auribacterota bacterium]NLW94274.1 electron transport complex protein RnfC [Chlamydiota bacterium]HOE26118.1 SLBB domain-containing protein [bacterium]
MTATLIDKVKQAGVVGAGGAGFPTWKKIDARVDVVIANGAECEPLLHNDQYLMAREAARVVRGMELVMEATGAGEGIVGLKEKYRDAVAAFRKTLGKKSRIRLAFLENAYPAGDEFVIVYETTGRVIPAGGLPLDVGVANSNVETFKNIADAAEGRPVVSRYVTVAGAVRAPATFEAPIGIAWGELIDAAGGPTVEEYALMLGGPMMGKLSYDASQPLTKTTGAVVVLPRDHLLVRRRTVPFTKSLHVTRQFCCQCDLCTMICPRYLLGHELYPHLVMRSVLFGLPFPAGAGTTSAHLCCECELCGLYICPMGLPIARINGNIKRNLKALGWAAGGKAPAPTPRPARETTRIATGRLVARLGLGRYNVRVPFSPKRLAPSRVSIPLKQNVGAAAVPCVKVGQRVRKGQVVAEIPEGALGARHHASIAGVVKEIKDAVVIAAA